MLFLLLMGALVAASAGHAPYPPIIPERDGLKWDRAPLFNDVIRVYPPKAKAEGFDGVARIDCVVGVGGALSDCAVAQQDPPEMGFGAAALTLMPKFQARPALPGGALTAGRTVRTTIFFQLPYFTARPIRVDRPQAQAAEVRVNCRVASSNQFENCYTIIIQPIPEGLSAIAVAEALRIAPPAGRSAGSRVMLLLKFSKAQPAQ